MNDKIPAGRHDGRGRLKCPLCPDSCAIPHDRWLTTGAMTCDNGHLFAITDDVAFAINSILSLTREGAWRKDNLKRFEGTPKPLKKDGL